MGTTLKKSYETRLTYIGEGRSTQEIFKISSWVLPGMLFYQEEGKRLFWIQGVNDEYGTMARKAGYIENFLSSSQIRYWEDEKELLELQPSPDGRRIAYIYRRESSPFIYEYFLAVWNPGKENAPSFIQKVRFWDESQDPKNPQYRLLWNGNSKLRVRMGKEEISYPLPQ